ncbi:PAS domain-containing protein [Loktanella sp. SALINAS62]|uniref:PAS domain-containing protein n=1 Tax=Loktanella sp. SALINAS62 TaxID=2706124 RepID=UPI001B8AE2D5|nr:PAS domain-containing protein [Loktanella sp. SALINAS62]MBS1302863.1 PAS domain-containing protein [Loktanella sp. SALINAS62]
MTKLTLLMPGLRPDPDPYVSDADRLLDVLETDWRAISRTGPIPRHSDIDPRALHAALPHAFVAARTAGGALRIRVAGQALHDLLQFDPRGMSVTCFFRDRSASTMLAMFDDMLSTPAILGVALTASRGIARRSITARLLALPLRDTQGRVTRLMGAIVTDRPVSLGGVRFDLNETAPIRHDVLGHAFPDPAPPKPITGFRPRLVVNNT